MKKCLLFFISLQIHAQPVPQSGPTARDAGISIKAHTLHHAAQQGWSLTGSGDSVAIFDFGRVRETHQELVGRIVHFNDLQTQAFNGHASSVAGIIASAGVVDSSRGIAPQAVIRNYLQSNYITGLSLATSLGFGISNHSHATFPGWNKFGNDWYWFGSDTISLDEDWRFGYYGNPARRIDSALFMNPNHLAVFAVSNSRGVGPAPSETQFYWDNSISNWVNITNHPSISPEPNGGIDGYDCLSPEAVAKNNLSVGCVEVNPQGYQSMADVILHPNSSWGPTDDGRIKPDVVAPGVGIITPNFDANDSYTTFSQTSAATPVVTGTAVLLRQYFREIYGTAPKASTLKALLIHSADRFGEGPNYRTGYGVINAHKAALLLRSDSLVGKGYFIREAQIAQDEVIRIPLLCSVNDSLTVTLAYTDREAEPLPINAQALNNRSSRLIHDLDIRLIHFDSQQVYAPFYLDPDNPQAAAQTGDNTKDNVEQICTPKNQTGLYILEISHKGTLNGGLQDFSLVISGAENPKRWIGNSLDLFKDANSWLGASKPQNQDVVFVPAGIADSLVLDSVYQIKAIEIQGNTCLKIQEGVSFGADYLAGKGKVLLKANDTQVATLMHKGGDENVQIESELWLKAKNINEGRWHYIGSPFSLPIQVLLQDSNSILNLNQNAGGVFYWDAAIGNYQAFSNSASLWTRGQGIVSFWGANAFGTFLMPLPNKARFTGSITHALNFQKPLEYTDNPVSDAFTSSIKDGWNLMANPYPTFYDWEGQSVPGNATAIYIRDDALGQWQVYTQGDVGNTLRYIPPFQAFWLRNASGNNQVLTFQEGQKVAQANQMLIKPQTVEKRVELFIWQPTDSNLILDKALLRTRDNASKGFDPEYDALKLPNSTPLPDLAFTGDTLLAVESVDAQKLKDTLNLELSIRESGFYCISARVQNFDFVYLMSANDAILKDLIQGDYCTFFPNGSMWLKLLLNQALQVKIQEESMVKYWVHEGLLFVRGHVNEDITININDMGGRKIYREIKYISFENQAFELPKSLRGIYLISIEHNKGLSHLKVIF